MIIEARNFETTRIYFWEWKCALYPDVHTNTHTHNV